jgi:hypothetical protein
MGANLATVNPYRSAFAEALGRLGWDFRPQSWRSRRALRRWRGRHAGDRCVILCNGPSLNQVDFDALGLCGVFTFGLNKIDLLFERTTFRPSCVVAVNRHVIDQNATFYRETQLPLFLDGGALKTIRSRSNVVFLHTTTGRGRQFARDCSISVPQGGTVTYVALQLAFHMGFAEVALVGCDHSYATPGPAHALVTSGEHDECHFDPRYFAGGAQWQLPDLLQSELSYRTALEVFSEAGRQLVNATAGGRLEVLPRRELGDFLGGART